MAAGERQLPDYLCFTAVEDNSTITRTGTYATFLEYSYDGFLWSAFDNTITVSLNTGDKVYFRGNNTRLGSSASAYTQFVMTGKLEGSGNIMSLLYASNFDTKLTIPNSYCFTHLFDGCSSLISAPDLPAITLSTNCYQYMFQGTGITTTPLLPATSLRGNCYNHMFNSCRSLSTALDFPTNVVNSENYSFGAMFYNCTSLTKAPTYIYAKANGTNDFRQMFYGCSNLTTGPKIMYTGASKNYSQREMFRNCSKLNWVMYLGTDISATNSLYNWMSGVQTTSGIFVKNINATWTTTGVSGVPTNWTIIYYDPTEDKYYTSQDKSQECDDHGNPL